MWVRFVGQDGAETIAEGLEGDTVLRFATDNSVDGIIGECGGSMACATCHGYVDDQWIDKLEAPGEAELAMLSGCIDVREGSRLTCQIVMTRELDGLTIHVPECQA